ncbi:MAG: DUF1801 domain-containing protein [Ignavibacteriaceae bacterium]|jgi:uncharacterized protein YdhG (YjbR/CyaY superfamily)|nr:DUF1801 domain-containing protein [Ignavibacteriaceae bacterium]
MAKTNFKSVDEYISTFPKDTRKILEQVRQTIKNSAPEAEETINYQIPTFKLSGNLVHFAAFKNHIGFYPTSSGQKAFEKELSVYKSGKGSIQFPIDKPLPLALIKKIVKYRIKENLGKDIGKPKKKKLL